VKFNQPGGLGVIGYPEGNFEPFVEVYPVRLPQNRSTTLVAWTDGFEQLCELCGIHQPWAVALLCHAYMVDRPQTYGTTNSPETLNSPAVLLLRYALARGIMGQIVDSLEGRLKIDDATVLVQSVGSTIIRPFTPTSLSVRNLTSMVDEFPYLDDMAIQNLNELTR
jgi:hypothetical protein